LQAKTVGTEINCREDGLLLHSQLFQTDKVRRAHQ
jgi:hypothetical protein